MSGFAVADWIAMMASERLNGAQAWPVILAAELLKLALSEDAGQDNDTLMLARAPLTSPEILPAPLLGPPTFEQLPYDIIARVLLSVAFTPKEMTAISSVSRRLHDITHSLGSFWATIDIWDLTALARVPVLLRRSGLAHLDVWLDAQPWTEWEDIGSFAATLLRPQVSRIRYLGITLSSSHPMSALLTHSLIFDELVKLRMNFTEVASAITVRAPRLRELGLFCPLWYRLEDLSARNVTFLATRIPREQFSKALIDDIFRHCLALVRLELSVEGSGGPCGEYSGVIASPPPGLARLSISIPLPYTIALMAVIPHGSLHRLDIVATSNFRAPPNELHPLVKHLVAAGGALGIFARRSYCNIWGGNITFRVESDDDGNDRGYALTLSHKQWSPHATNIWQQICAHHERLTSQSVEVDLETSNWFACAFKLCPPSGAPLELLFDPAIAEKHISSDVAGEGYFNPPPIYIPSLHYVTLARYSCDVAYLEDVLYFLADGYLLSDEPVADICICNILLPNDCNMPRALARLQFMLNNLDRRRLDRRHIPVWYICDHWVRNDTYAVPLPPESLFDRTDACPCCPDTSGYLSE